MSADAFPNARIRLRLASRAPGVGERTIKQTLWLRGSKFRIRDEAGRDLNEILGEVTAPRGLGVPARTMEDIMDRRSAARRAPAGPTELFGDLASDVGWVYGTGSSPWPKPAHELAPIARQVLAGDRIAALKQTASVTRLTRAATEYRGLVDVDADGTPRQNAVVRVVDPPFLLLDDVRDAASTEHFYVREIVELDLDVVTDADVALPP